ncbi:MAG: signal peptidase [Haloplasmataceae bacterium]|jgi:signal peptidase II|nr:signal peptidase [Haloplasmataceae bacterium]
MILYILVIVGLVALDQFTKYIVIQNIMGKKAIEIIPDFFNITYTENTGAAWSMFEGKMNLFYLVTVIALGIFVYLLITEGDITNKKLLTISLLMMIAGTIGNFIDRLMRHYVVDFLQFFPFGYDFPIFNVADMLLSVGTVGFAAVLLFTKQV